MIEDRPAGRQLALRRTARAAPSAPTPRRSSTTACRLLRPVRSDAASASAPAPSTTTWWSRSAAAHRRGDLVLLHGAPTHRPAASDRDGDRALLDVPGGRIGEGRRTGSRTTRARGDGVGHRRRGGREGSPRSACAASASRTASAMPEMSPPPPTGDEQGVRLLARVCSSSSRPMLAWPRIDVAVVVGRDEQRTADVGRLARAASSAGAGRPSTSTSSTPAPRRRASLTRGARRRRRSGRRIPSSRRDLRDGEAVVARRRGDRLERRPRWPALSAEAAPRTLKDPVRWSVSSFRQSRPAASISGVSAQMPTGGSAVASRAPAALAARRGLTRAASRSRRLQGARERRRAARETGSPCEIEHSVDVELEQRARAPRAARRAGRHGGRGREPAARGHSESSPSSPTISRSPGTSARCSA